MRGQGSLPGPARDAAAVVRALLQDLGAAWREPAPGEWGVRLQTSGGWPLDVGLRLQRGLLVVQAEVLGPGRVDPHALLHFGRRTALARFTETSSGVVWVQGELPVEGLAPEAVDRLLGTLVEAAEWARSVGG